MCSLKGPCSTKLTCCREGSQEDELVRRGLARVGAGASQPRNTVASNKTRSEDMPLYRLVDTDTEEVLKIRRMSHEAARHLNESVTESRQWIRGLSDDGVKPIKSLHQVLRSLDTEGFSDRSINIIEQYLDFEAKRRVGQREHFHRAKDNFRKVMREMSEADKRAVHAFIRTICGHSFHAGIQLGISGQLAMRELGDLGDAADE